MNSRQLIKKNKLNLMEWLRVDHNLILQHVHAEQIITDSEYRSIKGIRHPDEANSDLLDKIYEKGEETCASFLCVLDHKRIKETYPDVGKWLAVKSDGSRPKVAVVDTAVENENQIQDKLAFFEKNRSSLVRLVTNTMNILDDLKEEGFHSEMISEVIALGTHEGRMNMILDRIKVQKQAEILFKALAIHEKDILSDLIAKHIQQLSGYAPDRQKLSNQWRLASGDGVNFNNDSSPLGLKSGSCVDGLLMDPKPFQVVLKNEKGQTGFGGWDVPHKNAPHRSCESCAEVPDSCHWVMIKPYQVHKKNSISIYSLSSPAGSYECTVSSLRWSCACPVTFQLCFIDYRNHILAADLSPMKYRPAGPLVDISVNSGEVDEIHLPHFLCLGCSESFLKDAVRIIHMDVSGISIEKCELRRFHARLVKPSFSILGVFYSLKSFIFPGKAEEMEKQIKIHADVQVYRSSTVPLTFRAYLLPGDAQHRSLVKEQELEEGFRGFRLAKPRPEIPLQMNEFYVMKTDCTATIKPGKVMLRHSSIAPNFFNVSIREAIDFEMELLGSVDQQKVWQIDIAKSECCRQLQQGNVSVSIEPTENRLQYTTNAPPLEASSSGAVEMPSVSYIPGNSASVSSSIAAQTDKLAFLKRNRSSLISLVTNTMPILDFLKEEGFHSEMISEVAAERNDEARMRMILNKIRVQKQAEILFKALDMHEKDILSDLIAKYD